MTNSKWIHNFTGKAFNEKLLSNIDKEFIDGLFNIDGIIHIEIDRLDGESFNRYYIEISEDSIVDLVENDISRIYMHVTSNHSDSDWDVIDTVYKNTKELSGYKRNVFYWLTKKVETDNDSE